jgi:hypothetical protein
MACPRCGSHVVPVAQASGELLCPACSNTGVVQPQPTGTPQENAPGAVAALVLGIVSFLPYVGLVTSWIAIHQANAALRAIQANPGRYGGEGMARAGRIIAIVALGIFVGTVLLAAIVFVLVSNLSQRGA